MRQNVSDHNLNGMDVPAPPPLMKRIQQSQWVRLDHILAIAYALWVLPMMAKYANGPAGALAVLAGLAAFAGSLALRRRWLLGTLGMLVAGEAVTLLVEPRAYVAVILPMACVVYLAATGPHRTAYLALAVSLIAAAAAALPTFAHVGASVVSGFGYVTLWSVGYAVGMHRRYAAELVRQQSQRAQAELARARRDVTEERLRIARELHDVIAHSMSVITVQAAYGALTIDSQPAPARSALEAIETTGRQTLSELRALLGVLRTVDPSDTHEIDTLHPSPSFTDLNTLIRQTQHAGVEVELTVSVTQPMSAGAELTAYRIVQEALTNVVRHARTSRARVLIEQENGELVVEIADDGVGATSEPQPGHGLIGMRERVLAFGGVLHAAASDGGGFVVRATIPLGGLAISTHPYQAA